MEDIYDLIKNIESVYENNTSFQILKDVERVLDELDLYVYENWEDGELLSGPEISRHWITCKFMWPRNKMPDPMGGKRLVDYDCKIGYAKDYIVVPRKIKTPDDMRPGTKKGKLDKKPIWVVEIQMPKKLIADIYGSYAEAKGFNEEPAVNIEMPADDQAADDLSLESPDTSTNAAPAGETI